MQSNLIHIRASVNGLYIKDRLALDFSPSHKENSSDSDKGNSSEDGPNDDAGRILLSFGGGMILARLSAFVIRALCIVPKTPNLGTADTKVAVG